MVLCTLGMLETYITFIHTLYTFYSTYHIWVHHYVVFSFALMMPNNNYFHLRDTFLFQGSSEIHTTNPGA